MSLKATLDARIGLSRTEYENRRDYGSVFGVASSKPCNVTCGICKLIVMLVWAYDGIKSILRDQSPV